MPVTPLPAARPSVVPTATGRILVAEDDAALRELLVEVLSGAGHRVTAVPNGAEALARLTTESELRAEFKRTFEGERDESVRSEWMMELM